MANIMPKFDLETIYEDKDVEVEKEFTVAPDYVFVEHEDLCFSLKQVSVNRFIKTFSGSGVTVKKHVRGSGFMRYRKLSFMGKHLYLSSINGTKSIPIKDITSCVAVGKVITMEGKNVDRVTLEMPTLTDALAFRNVLTM